MSDITVRPLNCTRCDKRWQVEEEPAGYIDPDLYVCPDCLDPTGGQLELEVDNILRREYRRYDPDIAAIPF